MDIKVEAFKLAVSGAVASFMAAFGTDGKYIKVLIILMLADTAAGWLKCIKLGSFISGRAKWGFAGKIVELGLIYILAKLDWAFGTVNLLANIGILYYGIVEMASIIENINEGGLASLPPGLVDLIRKLKYSVGKAVVKKIKDAVVAAAGINPDQMKDDQQS